MIDCKFSQYRISTVSTNSDIMAHIKDMIKTIESENLKKTR